jgi:hypothetical protein
MPMTEGKDLSSSQTPILNKHNRGYNSNYKAGNPQ